MPFVAYVAIVVVVAGSIFCLVGAWVITEVTRKVGEMYFDRKYRGYTEYTDEFYRDFMKYKW